MNTKIKREIMLLTNYFEQGFMVLKIDQLKPVLDDFKREIFSVFSMFSEANGGIAVKSDDDIKKFRLTNQKMQFQALKHLWNSLILASIANHPEIRRCLESGGIKSPIMDLPPILRCDIPVKDQSLFLQHQDYVYNIGSKNSLTIWIPLQDTPEEVGALLVSPASHLGGVYPNLNGVIPEDYFFDYQSCPVNYGEALVFNQKLVHKSGFNHSETIRFSVILRFSDLSCNEYASRGFPINHRVTTEKYEGNVS